MNQIKSLVKSKECIICTIIVIIDLITKLVANYLLPFEEWVCIIEERVGLYLTYNQNPTAGRSHLALQKYPNESLMLILICLSALIVFGYILFIRKQKMRTIYKVLIGIGLYITLVEVIMKFVYPLFESINISSWTASVVGKLTGLVIILGIFYFFRLKKWIKLSLVLIFAGGIGNFLSHFYSPYRIIDFIYIEGSYELVRIGVFNVADLVIDIGYLGIIASVLFYKLKKGREYVIRKIKLYHEKQQNI